MSERTYLDWNATAPLRMEARAAMRAALDACGNPSSVHGEGRAARRRVEWGREQVAGLAGVSPRCVTFTSGGTEANALALGHHWRDGGPVFGRLLVSAVEHPSVLAGGSFATEQVATIPVTSGGVVDLLALDMLLEECRAAGVRPLVSVMLANNETGIVQPIAAVSERVHAAGGLLHVDAVQGAGRLDCRATALGADLLTISSHKLGGPTGVGALIRRSEALHGEGVIRGGGQERGMRAGTENVVGIVGFGAAVEAALASCDAESRMVAALRARLETGLKATRSDVVIFGEFRERLPNTILFAAPGARAETLVIGFDLEGVAVSSGAACSSGKVGASHVLAAMGVAPSVARAAIRLSLGWASSEDDVNRALEAWKKLVSGLSQNAEGRAA